LAIIGAGRLGTSFALAAASRGATITGYLCRTEEGAARAEGLLNAPPLSSLAEMATTEADIYILTVPDACLSQVAEEFCAALPDPTASSAETTSIIMHTSGATPLSVLDSCRKRGMHTLAWHPLQSFSDPTIGRHRFSGSAVAITGSSERAEEAGGKMAQALGASPFRLEDQSRALYHAAAVVAGNYLVTLLDAAAELFRTAGIPEEQALPALMPLAQGALDNTREHGTAGAITGPLVRGDTHTARQHLEALAQNAPDLDGLYRVLGLHTLELVRRQNELKEDALEEMRMLLNTPDMDESNSPQELDTSSFRVITKELRFDTQGHGHIINVTADVREMLTQTGLSAGTVTLFVPGATGGITTLEFEPGVVQDFARLFDQIVPPAQDYEHNVRLGDGNGHSHVRAGLLGPSMVVPFAQGDMTLGRWQEICFLCFDNRPRQRTLVAQFMGV